MVIRDVCPRCYSAKYKKNGHIHNGKQNHQCHDYGRQFVDCCEQYLVSEDAQPDENCGIERALHGVHYHQGSESPTSRPLRVLKGLAHLAEQGRRTKGLGQKVDGILRQAVTPYLIRRVA
jgi:hypothetical protein